MRNLATSTIVELTVLHRSGRRLRSSTTRLATRAALPYGFVIALFGGLVALLAFWGVNLTDGGLILAYAHRILAGEIPHKDFITPRPAGSAILHVVDFASPLPLVLTSKLITIGEFVAYGLFFSLLVYRKRLARLNLFELCGVSVAVLIGMHQFPIIDFYTIDGLVFVGLGFLVIRRGLAEERLTLVAIGFAALGVATTLKQSFWFAPLFAFGWVIGTRVAERRTRNGRWAMVAASTCAVAPALYAAYVALGGGFSAMRTELTGQQPVWVGDLVRDQLLNSGLRRHLLPELLVTIGLASLLYGGPRIHGRLPRLARFSHQVDLAARVLLTAFLLGVALKEGLRFADDNWAPQFFWCTLAFVVTRSLFTRRVDVGGVLVVFTAWMVSLSWGAPTPALAAGACAVYLADAIWRGHHVTGPLERRALVACTLFATIVVVGLFVDVRATKDYGVPRSTEDMLLGTTSRQLSGVHADPTTALYLENVAACTKQYPAKWVAVVPEGALSYPVFDLRNPFPIDWFWADDYRAPGDRERLLTAASRTDARGDYLVLFQRAPGGGTASSTEAAKIAPFVSDAPLAAQIASRLRHATSFVCGRFIAYFRPPA